MNFMIRRNLLKLSNVKSTSNSIYSLVLKTKFRRSTQPGLTRYNYDEYDHQSGNMNFSRLSHKTNAEELISVIPAIEGVNNYGWGHPTEFITLNTKSIDTPSTCKYCGLKYIKKHSHN